jgi:hypothetical protein
MRSRKLTQGGLRGKPMNVADRFVVEVVEIGERHKSKTQSGVLKAENMNPNQ